MYSCRVCDHRTRATGRGDNEHVRLCVNCFDLAGLENQVSDGEPLTEAQQREVSATAKLVNDRAGKVVWNTSTFGIPT